MAASLQKSLEAAFATTSKLSGQNKLSYFKQIDTKINDLVRSEILTKFLSYFQHDFRKYQPDSHKPFMDAISFLKDINQRVKKLLSNPTQQNIREKFHQTLITEILASRTDHMTDHIEATYFRAFRAYLNLEKHNSASMDCDDEDTGDDYSEYDSFAGLGEDRSQLCQGCSRDFNECDCEMTCMKFSKMSDNLRSLDLLEPLAGEAIMTVAGAMIDRRVVAKVGSNYACSYLDELTDWVQDVVKSWVINVRGFKQAAAIEDLAQQLDELLKNSYAEARVTHMFEIIIEYPSSAASIQDLKLCIDQSTSPSFRLDMIDSVKQSLEENLLHAGVNTHDILTTYISAIKALRALDPSGLILQLVAEPIRRYLKSRNDTVRCIVTALTDEDNNSELNQEMIRSSQTNENGGKSGVMEIIIPSEGEKCTASNFEDWKPDPIKLSSSDDIMKTSRYSDIISILVNIYETKDLFVEEYQKLLSQRLLNKYDRCNLDVELKNLELLTLRFNDCELHRCEVMLKDVNISKRIHRRICDGDIKDHKLTDFRDLEVLIVSSPFWPEKFGPIASLNDEPPKLMFPPNVQKAMDTYTKAFEAIQASRTLHWRHHLGAVSLDVTIKGKTHNFSVSPIHASLLYMFKNKTTWRLHELIHETSLTAATIRSRLALWQRNGLIRDCGDDKFELILE